MTRSVAVILPLLVVFSASAQKATHDVVVGVSQILSFAVELAEVTIPAGGRAEIPMAYTTNLENPELTVRLAAPLGRDGRVGIALADGSAAWTLDDGNPAVTQALDGRTARRAVLTATVEGDTPGSVPLVLEMTASGTDLVETASVRLEVSEPEGPTSPE